MIGETSQSMNIERMLELADILEKSTSYDQYKYHHYCGAPACVAGHAAVRWGEEDGFSRTSVMTDADGVADAVLGISGWATGVSLYDQWPFSAWPQPFAGRWRRTIHIVDGKERMSEQSKVAASYVRFLVARELMTKAGVRGLVWNQDEEKENTD